MKQHIVSLAVQHAVKVMGYDEFVSDPETAEDIMTDFIAGVNAVLLHPGEFGLANAMVN